MKGDYCLSFVVILQLVVTVLQLILPIYGFATVERAASLRMLVTVVTYVAAIYYVFKRRPSALILSFLFYAVFLLYNYLLYPDSHEFIESNRSYTLTPISILTVLIITSIRDFDCFQKVLLYVSRVCPVIALVYIYGRGIGAGLLQDQDYAYSMSMGYSFLLPCLFLFSQQKIIDELLSIVLFLVIVLDGSRGPVVIIAIFYLYQALFATKINTKKGWVVLVVAFLGVFAFSYLMRSGFFEESRTISLIASEELISYDSGRGEITPIVKRKIAENPILGYGVGADRGIIGGYVHNIFLEIFLHYGIVVGIILFTIFFYWCFKLYFNKNFLQYNGGRLFFIMMFLFGFVPMLVSGSYLIDISFAVMIGYLLRFNVTKKQVKFSSRYENIHHGNYRLA